jgi:hypothetical protein
MNFESLNNLAQANLLGLIGAITGIIGTVTGAIGLLISWINSRYNTPKIEIDKLDLIAPHYDRTDIENKVVRDFESGFLDYALEIVVRNKTGGAGSIDKPYLMIGIPTGKNIFFKKYRYLKIQPETEHTESKKESESVTKYWTVRHGRSFNLNGGEKIDDRLEYGIEKPQDIFDILKNFNSVNYSIEYTDNHGKIYNKRIKNVIDEDNDSDF